MVRVCRRLGYHGACEHAAAGRRRAECLNPRPSGVAKGRALGLGVLSRHLNVSHCGKFSKFLKIQTQNLSSEHARLLSSYFWPDAAFDPDADPSAAA